MENCLFCKFIEEHKEKVFEDDLFYIIKDISPQAPYHYLAIPKSHFKYLNDMTSDDILNLGKIMNKIAEISKNTLKLYSLSVKKFLNIAKI